MSKALSASGPAILRFPDGSSVTVDARLIVSRSFFSVSGEGDFLTDSNTASRAVLSDEPLSLTVEGSASADVVIHAAKSTEESARCWFRVHS